jgi:hypothetical protein
MAALAAVLMLAGMFGLIAYLSWLDKQDGYDDGYVQGYLDRLDDERRA